MTTRTTLAVGLRDAINADYGKGTVTTGWVKIAEWLDGVAAMLAPPESPANFTVAVDSAKAFGASLTEFGRLDLFIREMSRLSAALDRPQLRPAYDNDCAELALIRAATEHLTRPLDMVLYCPACGKQHIDAPDPLYDGGRAISADENLATLWTNPPHRSHLCGFCGVIWRPADVPTNGVASITTTGRNDTWPPGCKQCPHTVGDAYRRDCDYPRCAPEHSAAVADEPRVTPGQLYALHPLTGEILTGSPVSLAGGLPTEWRIAELHAAATDLIRHATAINHVVTISLAAQHPLRQGNYRMVAEVYKRHAPGPNHGVD